VLSWKVSLCSSNRLDDGANANHTINVSLCTYRRLAGGNKTMPWQNCLAGGADIIEKSMNWHPEVVKTCFPSWSAFFMELCLLAGLEHQSNTAQAWSNQWARHPLMHFPERARLLRLSLFEYVRPVMFVNTSYLQQPAKTIPSRPQHALKIPIHIMPSKTIKQANM